MGNSIGPCKLCDGEIIDKGDFYGCSHYTKNQCKLTIGKKILGKAVSATNAKRILTKGKSNLIKGFKKGEKTFDAYLVWDEQGKSVRFEFEGK
ncbi:topoisomerase C-terminal repeat-containing protein [Brevibacillus dissolubilis]|uniref:topoisomerase C-terminal repeat-containing protein n=1 Tax=Brevibacillus dissolubilis TaxID=1844116 RepID=UPI003F65A06F